MSPPPPHPRPSSLSRGVRLQTKRAIPVLTTLLTATAVIGLAWTGILSLKIQAQRARLDQHIKHGRFLLEETPLSPTQATMDQLTAQQKTLETRYSQCLELLDQGKPAAQALMADQPADALELYFNLKNMHADLHRVAQSTRDENGSPRVLLKSDMAFGFEHFLQNGNRPNDTAVQKALYQQGRIIHWLITTLFHSSEEAQNSIELQMVNREPVVDGVNPTLPGLFTMPPEISAAVPGSVDTTGFRLHFLARTPVLRHFLNAILASELPIMIRSVEVDQVPPRQSKPHASPETERQTSARPAQLVISDQASSFTVTLEYLTVL